MAMKLDKVVPFGRLLTEYQLMFRLTPGDMKRKILDVAGGPASFNAEMYRLSHFVTSIDPFMNLAVKKLSNVLMNAWTTSLRKLNLLLKIGFETIISRLNNCVEIGRKP